MQEQVLPEQLLERAKQKKHHYKVATEAFSIDGRQFVIHNLSLRKDYADEFDYTNFRRGLSLIEEIVDFKHSEVTVARKGLMKFRDLMAEYLDIKESHVNSSKFHFSERHRLFKELQNSNCQSYLIYNTQKVNGQNAQISVVCDKYWLVGSKNKCLLAQTEADLDKMKNKHEYKQNILMAKAWFKLLNNKNEEEVNALKLDLRDKTLVGQYCNMDNMQHLVNYGNEAHLFFNALVDKNNRKEDCIPLSSTFKFLEKHQLPKVKCQIIEAKSVEDTYQKLREEVVKMNEMTMKEGGEGSVLYVAGVDAEGERNMLVCKVKTMQYRIYRKLREKLKVYIQKYNQNYESLMKKFTKEISEIGREFKLNRPLEQYVEFAKRAFILCQDQNRAISRFIGNRYIDFLKLVQKNVSREKFMEIVNSDHYEGEEDEEEEIKKEDPNDKNNGLKKEQNEQKQKEKKVIVLVPISLPSSGKTSVLELVRKNFDPSFRLWSISSDEIRRQLMDELTNKMKNISRKQAFQKTGEKANKAFYVQMGEVFRDISASKEENHVFFIVKNHPESALKPGIKNIEEKSAQYNNIKITKVALLPRCDHRLSQKGLFNYPFSLPYLLTCLKRVASRPEHLTLEGSDEERCNIIIGFANLFRNFNPSAYNLGKYFNGKLEFTLHNQECLDRQKYSDVYELLKEILLKGKPGKFDPHPKLQQLVGILSKVELIQNDREASSKQALCDLELMFAHFDEISLKHEQKQQK